MYESEAGGYGGEALHAPPGYDSTAQPQMGEMGLPGTSFTPQQMMQQQPAGNGAGTGYVQPGSAPGAAFAPPSQQQMPPQQMPPQQTPQQTPLQAHTAAQFFQQTEMNPQQQQQMLQMLQQIMQANQGVAKME